MKQTPISILVVDDNPMNRKLVQALLVGHGYDVRAVSSAEEVLALLPGWRPELLLMDVQLPGMDGLELTRRLKADAATRDIRIVALTAYAMPGDEEKALAAGCDGYTTKPIDTGEFPALVAAYLSSKTEV